MLRDSHSYETQIIDAVRSVNKALGGTYGTSSAIYKSEFNQYEVQLIDAIKGIGRTLSGNGLSVSGGGGGASSAELQSLSARVSKLENESFFRLLDGNVTLKEQYQNLWVPGWLAAGGIGTGGGGGGGSSYLKELLDIYHNDSGILRGDGTAVSNGDVLVYDNTTDPTNPRWIAAAAGSGGVTVTNYGDITTGRIATVGSVDIYNGVKWGSAGSTDNTFTLTINGTTRTVCLEGYESGGGGGAYALGTLTTDTATKGTMLGVNAISNDLASTGSESSLIVWEPNAGGAGIGAWHFLGNIYSDGWISAGGVGSGGGGGGGGTDLATVWASLTNSVSDIYADTKINIAHIPSITTSMVSDLETWVAGKNYLTVGTAFTLRTPVTTSAANGTLLGVDALSNGSTSVAGSDTSRIEWDGDNYAWHVYGNLYADGWVSAGGLGSAGSSISLDDLSDVTLTSPTDGQALIYSNGVWVNGAGGGGDVYIGNASHSPTIADVVSSTYEDGQVLSYLGTQGKWTNVRLSLGDIDLPSSIASSSGYLYHDPVSGWAVMSGTGGSTVSWGTAYSDDTINLTVNGTTHRVCLYGYSSGGGSYSLPIATASTLGGIKVGSGLTINSSGVLSATGGSTVTVTPLVTTGTKIATISVGSSDYDLWAPTSGGGSGSTVNWGSGNDYYVPLTVDNVTKNVLIGTDYVTLSTAQTITGAKTFSTNPVTIASSSGLSVHQSSYIDIGPLRIEYDSTAKALHITKASSSDSNNYGIYADGFVAAGGSA